LHETVVNLIYSRRQETTWNLASFAASGRAYCSTH
jgi:hypothetical protein